MPLNRFKTLHDLNENFGGSMYLGVKWYGSADLHIPILS